MVNECFLACNNFLSANAVTPSAQPPKGYAAYTGLLSCILNRHIVSGEIYAQARLEKYHFSHCLQRRAAATADC